MIRSPNRQRYAGYWNLGPVFTRAQVPYGVRDRADGTVWYITASGDATPRIAIDTTAPLQGVTTPRIYAAGSEPFLNGADAVIFVRSGRLGFETQEPHLYSGARMLAPNIDNPYNVRYELLPPTGVALPLFRLAFETAPDW